MSTSFRPVEDRALDRVRRNELARTNWPAYQRWANIVKAEIKKEMKLAEQRVAWFNRHVK